MRISSLLALLFATFVSSAAELIPAEYVTEKHVASPDAPSSIVVADTGEPGERFTWHATRDLEMLRQ